MTENVAQTTERLMKTITEQERRIESLDPKWQRLERDRLERENNLLRYAILGLINGNRFTSLEDLLKSEQFVKLDYRVREIFIKRFLRNGNN